MVRTDITPALVEQAEQLLAAGVTVPVVAARLNITPYVVGVIANEPDRRPGPPPPPRTATRRVPNMQPGLDASTIRMIQRMLAVRILSHVEIAREAGVSPNTVTDVASGKRQAVTLSRPQRDEEEQFLREPIRCEQCRALISVVPCRACRATSEKDGSSVGGAALPTFHGPVHLAAVSP